MKNGKLALIAAALAAGLGGQPVAMADANHAAAYHRPRHIQTSQQRRHLTKTGPGRAGHMGRSRHTKVCTGWIHYGSGHRNIRKLLGTRG